MGGEVEAPSDGAVPRAPRRCALLLRPDHRHRHIAGGVQSEFRRCAAVVMGLSPGNDCAGLQLRGCSELGPFSMG